MNIISVEVAEFKANFDFIMSLVAKGHTVKINTGDKVAIITSCLLYTSPSPRDP